MAGPGREFVHLKVSKLTWRHVSSWSGSSFVGDGLEPLDPVGRRLVHYWDAAILEGTREVGPYLICAIIVRWVVGARRRGTVSFIWREPLLAG